jgi:hypothetical protein
MPVFVQHRDGFSVSAAWPRQINLDKAIEIFRPFADNTG